MAEVAIAIPQRTHNPRTMLRGTPYKPEFTRGFVNRTSSLWLSWAGVGLGCWLFVLMSALWYERHDLGLCQPSSRNS
jgi:hypothetical protein